MQKQRIILIIVGVVLALTAVFLIKVYMDKQRQIAIEEAERQAAKKQENQISVLVAKQDIPKAALIKPEMLETKIFPREYVAPQAVTSLDRISGMIVVAPITAGEQITLSKLSQSRQTSSLAEATPVGKRAITINVDNLASVAGMIKPGDYVDLIASVPIPMQTPDGKQVAQAATIPLFQNVLVLAVGQEISVVSPAGGRYTEKDEERRQSSSLITLALSPQEANLLAFVQEQGKFRLTLRSPADSQLQPLKPMSWEALFQYLMPKETAKPEAKAEAPVEYIEIYRGLKKEKMPLSK